MQQLICNAVYDAEEVDSCLRVDRIVKQEESWQQTWGRNRVNKKRVLGVRQPLARVKHIVIGEFLRSNRRRFAFDSGLVVEVETKDCLERGGAVNGHDAVDPNRGSYVDEDNQLTGLGMRTKAR
jgi:hypothetical protein